mgnify:CR=1 FL=1
MLAKSCMAGFVLKNTLSDNGGVTRGICKMGEDNNLTEVVETKNIVKAADGAEADGVAVDVNSLVSMNMWGLTPDFLNVLEDGFKEFFEKEVPGNPLKAEYLIPIFIGELLEQGKMSVKVLKTNDTWYVGDTINNKSTQKLFAGQDKHDLPKEQWYVAKNTHPAIIARDDFEKVQKILNKNRKVFNTVRAKSEQIRSEYQNDLAGMVFCADCGRPMEFERLPHGAEESKKVCYYICKARQADDKCIGHQIPEKLLKALIMDQLHLFIVQLCDKRKVLEELQKIEDVQNPVYRAKGEIMSLTDKVSQMAKKREQLYADYVAGVVDSEDYQLIREDYSRQYDSLRTALQEAENKKVQVEQQIEEYLNMASHLKEHLDNFEFDIQLVKSLVQRIEVSADKRIRIVFGFQDVFADLGKESVGK